MAELWTAFYGAREVLALSAVVALLAVLADAVATTIPAIGAPLAVLAVA